MAWNALLGLLLLLLLHSRVVGLAAVTCPSPTPMVSAEVALLLILEVAVEAMLSVVVPGCLLSRQLRLTPKGASVLWGHQREWYP
jgi:hypothetical protein